MIPLPPIIVASFVASGREVPTRSAGPSRNRSRARPASASATAVLCLLFAIADEYHQTFVPGRGGTWRDVAMFDDATRLLESGARMADRFESLLSRWEEMA